MKKSGPENAGKRPGAETYGPVLLVCVLMIIATLGFFRAKYAAPKKQAFLTCRESAKGVETGDERRCSNRIRFLAGQRMDFGSATRQDLMMLPHIGPKSADIIMRARQKTGRINNINQLEEMPGLTTSAIASLDKWSDLE